MSAGRWRRVLAVLLVGGSAGVAAWAVLFSPLLGVGTIVVSGNDRLSGAEIRRAAAVRDGQPLATLDVEAVRARIAALPRVERVTVDRRWPRTLRIAVRERTPIAVAPKDGRVALIDRYGVVVELRDKAPAGLPRLRVAHVAVDDAATRAALSVIHGLPAPVAGRVTQVRADRPGAVTLTLLDGRSVMWGGPERTARKARILQTLLIEQPGHDYDVSSPDVATVK